MRKAHNGCELVGQTYYRLTVVSRAENSKRGQRRWLCKCECGNDVTVLGTQLRNGHTKSCGCLSRDRVTKHGLCKSSEYIIWQQMKERCYNVKKESHKRYGARGITVCDRWRESFENFLADMGPRPAGMSLDRIDNNGNYEPGNCRWADNETQYRNRRQTVWIEFNGEKLCQKDWAKRYNIDEATLAQRIARGWPLEKAFTEPKKNSGGGRHKSVMLTYNGVTKCRQHWADEFGIDECTLKNRLDKGWSLEKALTTRPLTKGGGRRKEAKV